MATDANHPAIAAESLTRQVRRAVIWRSGSQIAAQLVQWGATFLVIRLLAPSDYGLFAMTQVVMSFLSMMNGYGLASALVRAPTVDRRQVRQLLGMLLLLNGGLAIAQALMAPLVAAYYRQPEIAGLVRAQALLNLTTPFIALPAALLGRALDFRAQASANMAAAVAGAVTALAGALAGWGVWTLVAAPAMLFCVRALMLTRAARMPLRPAFDFRGAGTLARFGGMMALGQLFWFLQSQSDVFIAGRTLSPHELGLYTTALFLAQIFVAKVVPPLNEVAFAAYARLRDDPAARGAAFVRAVGLVMAAALPFYLGLAVTAGPLVTAVLGAKWAAAAPVVALLALAMPFMTLQVLYAPACDAIGRPDVGVRSGMEGAAILTLAFLVGVRWGMTGLALAWLGAYPLYLALGSRRALPVIGARAGDLLHAVAPSAAAAVAMAGAVRLVDRALPVADAVPRLALLVGTGVLAYAAAMLLIARPLLRDIVSLARR
ncbi:lipopolysaccharide biosynthesis protein [Sphingomonas corticis]|jgi:O-antigen/teichoic acid export membrane protein|uniref:Lipopolysaccharide biosynthesis protein n=1 Tax=Sphingomonas corticis TaxID=2722791 RepID=A0ABX1CPB5_9SPHN|nr:lipopolysaccharide biosynthesis protein [Sphingomonas corticis]NJR79791.1 lipopolysaccharide biosynthesis protein [Sphingomonas corticis]